MPSPHPRIGLVVDQDMETALAAFRDPAGPRAADASLARRAVFAGAAVQTLANAAEDESAPYEAKARAALRELRDLLPQLALPEGVAAALLDVIQPVVDRRAGEERRQRQLQLIAAPDSDADRAALDYAESFDALDRLAQ